MAKIHKYSRKQHKRNKAASGEGARDSNLGLPLNQKIHPFDEWRRKNGKVNA
jgi:hypothetical protein